MARRAVLTLAAFCSTWLTACGGGAGTTLTSPPPPPPPPPPVVAPTVTTQQVFTQLPGFNAPVAMKQAPADNTRWFAVQQNGEILAFDNDPNVNNTDPFLDINVRVDSSFFESGLLGIAFHPDWPATPQVFVSYTASGSPLLSRISRFTSIDGGLTLDDTSEEILIAMPQDFDNHNGGDLHFGPDGFLYASFGDGGSAGDPNERAQDTSNLMGTIIRIDVDGNSPYEIPNSNPFAGGGLCFDGFNVGIPCPEIYAYGLRNPWRFSFDRTTGELWTGDVGQDAWEEVDRVTSGGNYGWDDREGAHCFEPMIGCDTNSLDPVTEYDHSLGVSITGGYVYRGAALPELQGWYVFADFGSGRLFAVDAAATPTVAPAIIEQTGLSPSTFAEGVDGELDLIAYGGGTIHQIVDAP